MRSKDLIVLCLLSEIFSTENYYLYTANFSLFNNSVEDCNNRGMELLTMSTYKQYLDAREFFNTHTLLSSWLALEFNTITGNYHWFNGNVLTELNWETGEPENTTGTDCGVIDVKSRKWYTTLCNKSKHYLCVGSDGSFSSSSTAVDFYTAFLNCQSEGRRLPVAITNLDTAWLNDVIINTWMSNDIWLGLIESGTEYGDYYRWVTGEHLTPPYTWKNFTGQADPYYNHHDNETEIEIASSWCTSCYYWYVCQMKSTESIALQLVRIPDKFVLVSNNAIVLGSSRYTTTINVLRRFQCALECLRDAGCIQFTIQGYLCRTFGESLVITDYNGGYVLWQRRVIT